MLFVERHKIGLVIGTYGTPAYMHLFLENAKKHFPKIPILVNDDCSNNPKLNDLCKEYDHDFYSNPARLGHGRGDLSAIINGLNWAYNKGLDTLVKMSRRFIPLFDWTKSLHILIFQHHAATYSSKCTRHKMPLRSECVAMNVKSWFKNIDTIKHISKPRIRVEHELFKVASKIDKRGFVFWEMLGHSREKFADNILWHDIHKPETYHNKAVEYGLFYSIEDFRF